MKKLFVILALALLATGCCQWMAECTSECARPSANAVHIGDASLDCWLKADGHQFTVEDKRTGRLWRSAPVAEGIRLVAVSRDSDQALTLSLEDVPTGSNYTCRVAIEPGAVLAFALTSEDPDVWPEAVFQYPPRLQTQFNRGQLVFCDRSNGNLIDQADNVYSGKALRVYGSFNCLNMPWIGMFDKVSGEGAMIYFDTPFDAEARIVQEPIDGLNWPQVEWMASLRTFRYDRRASYCFIDGGGYLTMAKMYREYAKGLGQIKTLRQKAAERPNVNRMLGAPTLWGWNGLPEFNRQAVNYGLRRGTINKGRPPLSPDEINKIKASGFLTGEYDSYTDILEGATGPQTDNVEKAASREWPGDEPRKAWKTLEGLQYYSRSSALWLEAARSYVPKFMEETPFNSRFIDVASAIELFEDYHPDHTFGREQDMKNRRGMLKYMSEQGLVVGGEFGNAWAVDLLDETEGGMSCNTFMPWKADHLLFPEPVEIIRKGYTKYAMGYGNRVPLWELVFHDCVVNTWFWGDTAGFVYDVAPELSDRKDLFNILYGTVPLMWIDDKNGYGWNRNRDRLLQTYNDTCKLHEVIGFEEMISHEMLSGDCAMQRTRFADGTAVVVNFSEEPREYGEGPKAVTLAPRGFYVDSEAIMQQRLWVDGEAETLIRKEGYLTAESESPRTVGPVTLEGRMTAFEFESGRWHLILKPEHEYALDWAAISDWDASEAIKVVLLNADGETQGDAPFEYDDGRLAIKTGENQMLYAVTKQ